MIKINLKKIARILGQTGIGGGTTYVCYAKAGLSEEQSIGAGVGAFVLSGIAFDVIFPDDNGREKLWKKLKRCNTSEDLEALVDELTDDDDDEDEEDEETDVTNDSLQECGESDPTEETIVSSTTEEENNDWTEQELEEFGNVFTETFSNALDELLESRPISLEELTETLDFDENGKSISDNGIHWQIPVHSQNIKPSNKKERRAKNMRRNNALLKQYNQQRRKEFEAGMNSDSEASAI